MITPLFHPRVDPGTGKMDLRGIIHENVHTWDVLHGLKKALIWDCNEYCKGKVYNQEAADIYKDSQKGKIRAFATVSKSMDHLYDEIDSKIVF